MVRLGKVHGNRMVDVAVTNSKLEDRALRILMDLAGVSRQQGATLLKAAHGSVKLALLISLAGVDADRGRVLLQRHSGNLRQALAALEPLAASADIQVSG
jgi:N-acetylmuramic acid 6-phosphate etherase